MDNFIGTLIFLLPGLLLYFWLQSFGINPVVKHNPAEFTAVSVLLWFPVSITTLLIFNGMVKLSSLLITYEMITNIDDLKKVSTSFGFLTIFLIMSAIVSFVYGVIWARWLNKLLLKVINKVRTWGGQAALSNKPSVWDEVFLNNDSQVVEIGKIDKPGETMTGCIKKVSRPFEPERNLFLEDVEFFKNLIDEYDIPVVNIFFDTKSGTYVKIFDSEIIHDAQCGKIKKREKVEEKENTTSDSSQTEPAQT